MALLYMVITMHQTAGQHLPAIEEELGRRVCQLHLENRFLDREQERTTQIQLYTIGARKHRRQPYRRYQEGRPCHQILLMDLLASKAVYALPQAVECSSTNNRMNGAQQALGEQVLQDRKKSFNSTITGRIYYATPAKQACRFAIPLNLRSNLLLFAIVQQVVLMYIRSAHCS